VTVWRVSTEPYDFSSWCLILLFSVHASGAALFLVEWLSPNGLDQGMKPIRGTYAQNNYFLQWSMAHSVYAVQAKLKL